MKPPTFRIGPRTAGALLSGIGLSLLVPKSLLSAALGLELLAAGFWCWARAAEDASEQVKRWAWVRRPAIALWLGMAIHMTTPAILHDVRLPLSGTYELLRWLEAITVAWAGLELVAALPLARPYSDLPGPFLEMRPWLPVLLPAAGFMVLWRQSSHWIRVGPIGPWVAVLLLVTAALGTLRAFARRGWIASLRWLAVADSALAGMLVALNAAPPHTSLLLWIGAFGGHACLLGSEVRGAVMRRGRLNTRMWRVAAWSALTALYWPVLVAVGFGPTAPLGAIGFVMVALPATLGAWVTVRRMVEAPERRRVPRPNPALTLSQLLALVVLALGPVTLIFAWWSGTEPSGRAAFLALLPTVLGAGAATAVRRVQSLPGWDRLARLGEHAPRLAGAAFRIVVGVEQRAVAFLGRLMRAATAPFHDLHTGDAQEYLLFLIGLGVLALVLPLLQ